MITYDELAAGLEDAWLIAGLHDHALYETVQPETLERVYRVELFPEHPEPLTEGTSPPWVELSYTWTPTHQLHSEGREIAPGVLELSWTYTVDVRTGAERSDVELVRAFNGSVRAALRRVSPELPAPGEYIAAEMRRGYRTSGERPSLAYTQIVGTNVTDLSDLWTSRGPDDLRDALRDELVVVAAVLHALAESFSPGGVGGYRSVDTA